MKPQWNKMTLGDFVAIRRGHDLTASERREGNIPVFGAAGQNGTHDTSIAKGPGIIIGRSGGSFGKVHYSKHDFWPHNTGLYVTDLKGNDCLFTYYLLKSINFDSFNSGSAQPSLNRNFIYPIPICVPKVQEQKEISTLLSALDAKIELNNRINAELEAMAKTLYDYWFVQFDFPDENGKPYKSSGGKMVYNETLKREIPDGWEDDSLWNIADYFNGLAMQKHRPTSDDYLRVIKIKEMTEGFSDKTEKAKASIPSKAIVNDGDVLFSWSATLLVQVWSQGVGALNQHIFKVTSKKYPKTFYYYELRNYLNHFKMMAEKRKTTMGHITQEHLKQSRIVIPKKELIEAMDVQLKPIFQKQMVLEKENQQLTQLRDWLLPMLMNGQVTVK